MSDKRLAIVDYGLGNLFSVEQACRAAEIESFISSDPKEVGSATAILLPGVGAFGDAMNRLVASGLGDAILSVAKAGRLVIGVCLGMQLLCRASDEFGAYEGLGLVDAHVRRLPDGMRGPGGTLAKVPEVGWNAAREAREGAWAKTPLAGIKSGASFYFVHSFVVVPAAETVASSWATYGEATFCASIHSANIHAFQFHPERSGRVGLKVYRNIAAMLDPTMQGEMQV